MNRTLVAKKNNKIRIVYIMGAGRSGSTILGILLGNCKNYFYPGELFYWNIYNGIPNQDNESVVEFWEGFRKEFPSSEKYFHKDFYKYLEHHSSIIKFSKSQKKLVGEYEEFNKIMIPNLSRHSGCDNIIDSSRYPLRVLRLKKYFDVSLLYIYRDPASVVESFNKKGLEHKYKSPLSANLYLFLVSLLSSVVYLMFKSDQRIKIRFEDLIERTDSTLNMLEGFLNFNKDEIDLSNLDTGYIFESNRIRKNTKIELNRDINRPKLNAGWRIFTALVQFPFLLFNPRLKEKDERS